MINRRGLITGLVSFIAAPAVVRATSIMPVRSLPVFNGMIEPGQILSGGVDQIFGWVARLNSETMEIDWSIVKVEDALYMAPSALLRVVPYVIEPHTESDDGSPM